MVNKVKHLKHKGSRFYFQQAIPAWAQAAYGRKVITKSLKTDSFATAGQLAEIEARQTKGELSALRAMQRMGRAVTPEALAAIRTARAHDPETRLALIRIREEARQRHYDALLNDPELEGWSPFDLMLQPQFDTETEQALRQHKLANDPAISQAVARARYEALQDAERLYKSGHAPPQHHPASGEPIASLMPDFFKSGTLRDKAKKAYQNDLESFVSWLEAHGLPDAIGTVSGEVAADYVSAMPDMKTRDGAPLGPKSINTKITSLSSFWKYLQKRKRSATNPWSGLRLSLTKVKAARIQKRPFTVDEVRDILREPMSKTTRDAITMSLLSSARFSELANARVGDFQNMVWHVWGHGLPSATWHPRLMGKTEAARRIIPVHSGLARMIEERCRGKKASALLFHEFARASGRKGQQVTNEFRHLLTQLGIRTLEPGEKQARVDFHSLRRTFIRWARDYLRNGGTGFNESDIARVAGHEDDKSNPMQILYEGTSELETLRRVVESVRLPQ